MKLPVPALLFLFLAQFTLFVKADTALQAAIQDDYPYLESLYIHLHENPEISFQEENTSARMANELRGLGFTVTEKVGGYGVVGVLENGEGPTVLLRTDMDALPVLEKNRQTLCQQGDHCRWARQNGQCHARLCP